MKAALLAIAAIATPLVPESCVGALCQPGALAPWFAKLAAARPKQGDSPLHILQIGDSHTAGDALTGAWRDLLQARLGSGGRGVLPPGRPYEGYITRGVTATMSSGWAIGSSFGKGAAAPRPPLGLSGFSLTSTLGGASLGMRAEPAMTFDRVTLCALGGAGGAILRLDESTTERLDFNGPAGRPICRTVRSATRHNKMEIVAEAPGFTVTSWGTFREAGGVVLSNLGVVGSQLAHFARTDDAVIAEELRAYRPDLIVLAFGTNEGFAPHFDPVTFEAVLRSQIARLRILSGDVPMLLLGAPDALSRQAPLRANAPIGDAIGCDAGLFAPPALAMVRAIQRRIAAELGLAFWDWQARMGGPCAARDWVGRAPPLMRADHVHFTTTGGLEIAKRLQADLDRGAASAE